MAMNHNNKAENAGELWGNYLSYLVILGLVVFLLYSNSLIFITFWRGIRLVELMIWNSVFELFSLDFFGKWLHHLQKTPPTKINWAYISSFESSLNSYLRFVYAPWLFYFGYCMQRNKKKVTGQLNVQSLIESYASENEAIASLVDDNPLKHNRVFDFNNRDDYHNRHAQAISPQRYIEACPPPNASIEEMKRHNKAIAKKKQSPFRPIAKINRKENKLDFCRSTARIALERQLTSPPSDNGYYLYEENVPRLFDQNGELVPLVKTQYKAKGKKREERITGGFAKNGLLNNGREFKGKASDLRLLFSSAEREVFDKLCRRYSHPHVPLAKYALELTKRHAYTKTYLIALLRTVSEHNLIASTEFYMLCRRDRALYFALYSAREEKPFYEGMGSMAHFAMETLVGKKLTRPYVETGINALEKDARRIANRKTPTRDLINELNANLVLDPDLNNARAYTDKDDKEMTSLLTGSLKEKGYQV